MTAQCPLCVSASGLHALTCQGCCLRLIRSTPERSPARKAMVAHVRASIGEERWEALLDAARLPPKPRSREP